MCSALLILILWMKVSWSWSAPAANVPPSEFSALFDLYNATNGANWYWRPLGAGAIWNFTSAKNNPCQPAWQGIGCRYFAPYNRVVDLTLVSYNLSGPIPPSIQNLTHAYIITLGFNQLTGTLPATIGSLKQLNVLDVSDNYMSGTIPHTIGNLTNLQQIDFQFNHFSGRLPVQLGNLKAINVLNLAGNRFTGPIPDVLGSLSSLSVIEMFANQLSGSIPSSLGALPLVDLYLQVNHLSGTLAPELHNLTRLRNFDVANNILTGTVPEYVGTFTQLRNLYVHTNKMTGSLPNSLGNITFLQFLDCSSNKFHGTLPASLAALAFLQYIQVFDNYLSGTVPAEWYALQTLQQLDLNSNRLTGTLPSTLHSWPNMLLFDVSSNFLSGTIAATAGNLTYLQYFAVDNNFLTGSVPAEISTLNVLTTLHLQNNQLTGDLSRVFNATRQTSLAAIEVSSNQFSGTLPAEIFLLPKLTSLVAVRNCFSGQLPSSVCGALTLQSLVLDGLSSADACRSELIQGLLTTYFIEKSVKGKLPGCLFQLPALTTLHLSGNGFTGPLPDVNLSTALVDVILSHNRLTGSIPAAIQERQWYNLDLSYNRLGGTLLNSMASVAVNLTAAAQVQLESLYGVRYENLTAIPALSLVNNRLSGKIPTTLKTMLNISVLGSNVFSCDLQGDELPAHDSGRNNYQCGSSRFNVTYYVWLGILVVGAASLAAWWRLYSSNPGGMYELTRAYLKVWDVYSWEGVGYKPRLTTFGHLLSLMSRMSVVCAVAIVVVLLPLFLLSGHFYGTYTHQYAWAASGAYLSGAVVVSLKLVFLSVFLAAVLAVFSRRVARKVTKEEEVVPLEHPTAGQYIAICAAYVAVNAVAMVGVNVAYVYVAIYQSSALLVLAQILLSLWKLLWNNVLSAHVLQRIVRSLWRTNEDELTAYADTQFVRLQIAVALLNSIAIPCVVVAVISPSCFYNLFIPSPAVTSYYTYQYCAVFTEAGTCQVSETRVGSTAYDPPFAYSYQCSSSFITYYAPALINSCIISAFFTPTLLVFVPYWRQRLTPGSVMYNLIGKLTPPLLHPPAAIIKPGARLLRPNQKLRILITYFGSLLTFGAMFPPLAVAYAISICAFVYTVKFKVGRFLATAAEMGMPQYVDVLDLECRGVGTVSVVKSAMWMLIAISCWFYTLFLFDTLGDAVGFDGAYWVIIVVPLLPVCLYAVWSARERMRALQDTNTEEKLQSPSLPVGLAAAEFGASALPDVELPDVVSSQHNKRTSKNVPAPESAESHLVALELGVSAVTDDQTVRRDSKEDDGGEEGTINAMLL